MNDHNLDIIDELIRQNRYSEAIASLESKPATREVLYRLIKALTLEILWANKTLQGGPRTAAMNKFIFSDYPGRICVLSNSFLKIGPQTDKYSKEITDLRKLVAGVIAPRPCAHEPFTLKGATSVEKLHEALSHPESASPEEQRFLKAMSALTALLRALPYFSLVDTSSQLSEQDATTSGLEEVWNNIRDSARVYATVSGLSGSERMRTLFSLVNGLAKLKDNIDYFLTNTPPTDARRADVSQLKQTIERLHRKAR